MTKYRLIEKEILDPIGCPPLKELVKNKKSILIVTDDNTRATPIKAILPYLLNELKKGGVPPDRVKILIASGTHRPMTYQEMARKFGNKIVSGYRIYNHSWNDKRALTSINSRICGKKIKVNKLAASSDFIIGLGSILPHATTGFSGGGKIILPGICGEETVEDMHWKALDFEIKDILGVYKNPMRKIVDTVARKAGLKFIVNTIVDTSNRFVRAVAGDPINAHKKGVEIAKKVFSVKIAHPADVVVADARPMDIDLRQAIKAIAASDLVVKKGGVIILNARCPEGISCQFPEFEAYGFSDPDGLKAKVDSGKIKGKLMAYTLIAIGRILKYKAKVILVSKGVSREAAERMGFLWASSMKAAMKEAKKSVGKNARVIFLKRAGELLPLVS